MRLIPQPDQDDSELMPAITTIRLTPTADTDPADPEPVCLPGQVCEDVESLCVPGPSRMEKPLDTDVADPESSPVADPSSSDLGDGESSLLLVYVISAIFYVLCSVLFLLVICHFDSLLEYNTFVVLFSLLKALCTYSNLI